MIDWKLIRRKGKQLFLTADEIDALCELAESVVIDDWCDFCGAMADADSRLPIPHKSDCPVRVLEEVER